MRAIKIDSKKRTVTEIEIDPQETLQDMQAAVGGCIQVAVEFPNGDVIMVNEEGLVGEQNEFFYHTDGHQPFAGDGIVVGDDGEGETAACKSTLEELKKDIHFVDAYEVSLLLRGGRWK